jgi:hypothetical protein
VGFPAGRQRGRVFGVLDAEEPLDPIPDLGEPVRALRIVQAKPERCRRVGGPQPGDRRVELLALLLDRCEHHDVRAGELLQPGPQRADLALGARQLSAQFLELGS